MRLDENPILHTQLALARRSGHHLVVGVAVLGVLAMGWLYLDELGRAMRLGYTWRAERLATEAYGMTLVAQMIVAALGAVTVARGLAQHRQDGVLDANRLTPMRPQDLAAGYWLGPLLAPLALILTGTLFACFVALVSQGVSLVPILQSQATVLAVTAMLGLLAAWVALEVPTPSSAVLVTVGGLMLMPFGLAFGESFVVNHALGLHVHGAALGDQVPEALHLLGLDVAPLALSTLLQAAVVALTWRVVVRKMARPEERGLTPGAALVAVLVAVLTQHLLVAPAWWEFVAEARWWQLEELVTGLYAFSLAAVLAASLAAGLSGAAVRRAVLSHGRSDRAIALGSGVALAATGALVAGLAFFAHPQQDLASTAVGVVDFGATLIGLAAVVEAVRFHGTRRAAVVALLLVGATFFVPIFFAIVSEDEIAMAALGISGALLLQDGAGYGSDFAPKAFGTALHLGLAIAALQVWRSELRRLVAECRSAST